jgi:S-adenosylmethionine hydrolase
MKLISLTTDFGIQDGYVGVMKAVIYGIAPDVKIIDIGHQIAPQHVLQGGLTAIGHVGYFPEESVHIIVVDPGVGTERRPLAAKIGSQYYVCPDNGLLSPMIEQGEQHGWPMKFVCLDEPAYWLEKISNTFHARDIFSPVGAHLANGVPLNAVGSSLKDPVMLSLPRPQMKRDHIIGEVTYIDRFGNLRTNVRWANLQTLAQGSSFKIKIGGRTIDRLVDTFGDAQPGHLVALMREDGPLGISKVNGSAAEELKATIGAKVEVTWG